MKQQTRSAQPKTATTKKRGATTVKPAPKRVPSYRLHKGTGQGFVELAGQRRYCGKYGTPESVAKYNQLVQDWLASDRRLPPEPEARAAITITELILAFEAYARDYYRQDDGEPSTEYLHYRTVCRIVRERFGNVLAREFGPTMLKALRQSMIDRGWTRASINRQISRVRSVLKWGVSEGLVPYEVHAALTTVGGLRKGRCAASEGKNVSPVTEAAVNATLDHMTPVLADSRLAQTLVFQCD